MKPLKYIIWLAILILFSLMIPARYTVGEVSPLEEVVLPLYGGSVLGWKSSIVAQNGLYSHDMGKNRVMELIRQRAEFWGLDSRVLLDIAECESKFTQFNKNGSVLSGIVHNPDKGIFQINIKVWGETSDSTGYDWRTVEGNVELAMYIAKNYGYSQWVCF